MAQTGAACSSAEPRHAETAARYARPRGPPVEWWGKDGCWYEEYQGKYWRWCTIVERWITYEEAMGRFTATFRQELERHPWSGS